jgi:type IV pilus assembly protein PilE
MHRYETTFAPRHRSQHGFTLLELMITAAIVAILGAVALPSYKQYLIKGKRAAAEAAMMEIANREQQYFLSNRTYTATLSGTTGLNYTLPSEVSAYYAAAVSTTDTLSSACAVTAETTVPTFVLTMTPITGGSQASDGNLYLSNTGTKCPSGKW